MSKKAQKEIPENAIAYMDRSRYDRASQEEKARQKEFDSFRYGVREGNGPSEIPFTWGESKSEEMKKQSLKRAHADQRKRNRIFREKMAVYEEMKKKAREEKKKELERLAGLASLARLARLEKSQSLKRTGARQPNRATLPEQIRRVQTKKKPRKSDFDEREEEEEKEEEEAETRMKRKPGREAEVRQIMYNLFGE